MPRDGSVAGRDQMVTDRLAWLSAADRAELCAAWAEAFGSPPPRYTSVPFMRRALAYEVQCQAWGGMSKAMWRALKTALDGRDAGDIGAGTGTVRPGAVLVREWNGRTYRVEAIGDGFRMDGRTYGSLSAVARKITGTTWSGPRFFGLTDRRGQGA